MPAAQTHIIGKQILDVEVPASIDAHEIQERLSWTYRNYIVPRLSALFDQLAGKDIYIQLDQLNIDLGDLPFSQLEAVFVERVLKQVDEQVQDALQGYSGDGASWPAKIQPVTHATLEVWVHFLEYGYLPWHALKKEHPVWETQLVAALEQGIESGRVLPSLHKLSGTAIRRMVAQFSDQVIRAFIACVTGRHSGAILFYHQLLIEAISSVKPGSHTGQTMVKLVWSILLAQVVQNANGKTVRRALVAKGLPAIATVLQIKPVVLIQAMLEVLRLRKDRQAPALDETKIISELEESLTALDNALPSVHRSKEDSERAIEAGMDSMLDDVRPELHEQLEEAGIHIENAGLVLLHPYLPQFFESIGLTSGKAFKNDEAQHQAIHALQYLASGQHDQPEYDLVLNKVLCGIALRTPIEEAIDLSAAMTQEAEHLLEAVIGHWSALGNTTPDGLRFNFLMRPGRLIREDAGWSLQVEKKTQDVLLGRLPWGMSMIKLPWMEGMLRVAWG